MALDPSTDSPNTPSANAAAMRRAGYADQLTDESGRTGTFVAAWRKRDWKTRFVAKV
jgi:hypothetical protein